MAEAGGTSPAVRLEEQVVVVLVEPQHPGNVGAVARAMKNRGLRRLVIVDPPAYDPQRARWMAPGCDDLLAGARIVATLDEALEGVHRAIASTARHRKHGQPVREPRQVAEAIFDAPEGHVTAILFGREDFGLAAADVHRCAEILRIPTPEHASLNLAQAVMVVGHELFEEARQRGVVATGRTVGGRRERTTRSLRKTGGREAPAEIGHIEPAVAEAVALLDRVGYTRAAGAEKVALTLRAALQDAGPSIRTVEALRGMVARVQWALDHPDVDWNAPRKR